MTQPTHRRFAISDIHGHLPPLKRLLQRLDYGSDDELFLLGDFIDRGPDSKGVIDKVEDLRATGHAVHCLRGNHEQMALSAAPGNGAWRSWLAHGGKDTCASWGTYGEWTVPPAYRRWMEALPLSLESPGYVMVHAGIDHDRADPLAATQDLLWLRDWYTPEVKNWLNGRILLHGHTPQTRSLIAAQAANAETRGVVGIDAGCFHTRAGMGHLCALRLGTNEVTFEERVGD